MGGDWRLALYPPSFRERYGDELDALIIEFGERPITVDLLRGAVRAWLRPVMPGECRERARRRLQSSVSTSWVAWCFGFLAAPAVNRALLDPPMPGVDHAVRTLLDVAQVAFFAGGVGAFLAGAPLAATILPSALKRRDRRVVAPLLPSAAIGAIEATGLGILALLRRGHSGNWPHPSIPFVLVGTAWLAGFAAFVVVAAAGPPLVLTRVRPDGFALRWAASITGLVTAALLVVTVASLAAVVLAGPDIFSLPAIVVAVGASAAAVTSSGRAYRSLAQA